MRNEDRSDQFETLMNLCFLSTTTFIDPYRTEILTMKFSRPAERGVDFTLKLMINGDAQEITRQLRIIMLIMLLYCFMINFSLPRFMKILSIQEGDYYTAEVLCNVMPS